MNNESTEQQPIDEKNGIPLCDTIIEILSHGFDSIIIHSFFS